MGPLAILLLVWRLISSAGLIIKVAGGAIFMVWGALPTWMKQAIVLIVAGVGVYMYAYSAGRHEVQAQWDYAKAVQAAILEKAADDAVARAANATPDVTPEDRAADTAQPAAPGREPCRVYNQDDRDCAGRRP